jgi:3-hydroxymyristoyl/3-hydroxydecanoyl-(acyl carrier protein) dehydratase
MGFVFVDRISAITADHARGELRREPDAPPLPPWLVIEAVGQLAAWIAMARGNFATRPVAALVGDVRLSGTDVGGPLTLEARIDRVDSRAVLYSGSARIGDTEIAALRRCVGPLLPAHLFDDPAALRQRFAALCAGPLPPGAGGAEGVLPRAELSALALRGGAASAQLRVPSAAPFFADHFPRRAVYPAALLADAQNQVAAPLAAQVLGVAPERMRPTHVADFKVRAFSPPGQVLDLIAETHPSADGTVAIAVAATVEGRRIATGVLGYRIASPP